MRLYQQFFRYDLQHDIALQLNQVEPLDKQQAITSANNDLFQPLRSHNVVTL